MYIDQLRTLGVFGLCFWLAACATPEDGTPPYMGGPTNFGEANRQTMAAQIIDPTPVYDTLVPESSGAHAGQAVERYRTDKVKLPVNPRASLSTGAAGTPK